MVNKYIQFLKDEIHSAVFATTDQQGHPKTCIIDIMLADEQGIYFITAKGKEFYTRLKAQPYVAVSGMKGSDTLSTESISLSGPVRDVGQDLLMDVFEKNPYMKKIYPNEESRSMLTVFQIHEGEGEYFRISEKEIFRERFSFGGKAIGSQGYVIKDSCNGCQKCLDVCPRGCIDLKRIPASICQSYCIHCGMCAKICPEQAIAYQK